MSVWHNDFRYVLSQSPRPRWQRVEDYYPWEYYRVGMLRLSNRRETVFPEDVAEVATAWPPRKHLATTDGSYSY